MNWRLEVGRIGLDVGRGGGRTGGVAAYPLKFRPVCKQRIWGGRRLAEVFSKELRPGERIGESRELADLPNDRSVVENDAFNGGLVFHLKDH